MDCRRSLLFTVGLSLSLPDGWRRRLIPVTLEWVPRQNPRQRRKDQPCRPSVVFFRSYCNYFAPGVHSSSEATPGQALHQGILVGVRSLPCCLPVAQLKSLREVCMGLASSESPLQHLDISETFTESTPGGSHANRPLLLTQTVFTQCLARGRPQPSAP